jgi:cytoskeletal protein RodZ
MAAHMTPHHTSAGDFGSRMRQIREQRGVSLRQIAETTKLSVSALEALERNDVLRLPGGIFSRAFVRSYAAEIGVDPGQAVREFLSEFPHDSTMAGHSRAVQDDRARGSRLIRRGMMIAATVVVVVVAILFWSLK